MLFERVHTIFWLAVLISLSLDVTKAFALFCAMCIRRSLNNSRVWCLSTLLAQIGEKINVGRMQYNTVIYLCPARTRITNPPQDQSVIKGTKAAMTCGVTHDPSVSVK